MPCGPHFRHAPVRVRGDAAGRDRLGHLRADAHHQPESGDQQPRASAAFEAAVSRAVAAGVAVVAARDDEGVRWLPGCLPGVVQVQVDWNCPREHVQVARVEGEVVFRASGFARPIPGWNPRHNLHGVSFAVANVSGVLAPPSALPGHRPCETCRVPGALRWRAAGAGGAAGAGRMTRKGWSGRSGWKGWNGLKGWRGCHGGRS